MKNSNLQQFTGLYPVQKTLRFELMPIGKTLENIKSSGVLEADEHGADSYYSLIGNCKALGVDPRKWLEDVLIRIPDNVTDSTVLRDLLPDRWGKASL